MSSQKRERVTRFLRRVNWSFGTAPSLNPGGFGALDLRTTGKVATQGAVTTCEIAKAVCQPVENLTRRGGALYTPPHAGYYPQGAYYPPITGVQRQQLLNELAALQTEK